MRGILVLHGKCPSRRRRLRMCLPVVIRLERLGGAAVPHGFGRLRLAIWVQTARRLLLCDLGQVQLSLFDLAAELVESLGPVGAVLLEVGQGLDGELYVLRDGRGLGAPP